MTTINLPLSMGFIGQLTVLFLPLLVMNLSTYFPTTGTWVLSFLPYALCCASTSAHVGSIEYMVGRSGVERTAATQPFWGEEVFWFFFLR